MGEGEVTGWAVLFFQGVFIGTPGAVLRGGNHSREDIRAVFARGAVLLVGLGGGVEGEETAGEGFDSGDDLRREAIAGWYRRRRRRRGDEKVEHGSEERYRSVFRERSVFRDEGEIETGVAIER